MTYKVNSIELRKCMIGRGYLTIEDLSQAASVNRNTIGDILKGKGRPSSAVIERIATALGLSGTDIGRIFFDSDLA